jgi:hypothetical protein
MVERGARRQAGGRECARYGLLPATCALGLALAAGCASAQSTGPPDCSARFAMSAAPVSVRPGDLVALSDNAPAAWASNAQLGDPGTLGTVSHGRYTPLWNLGVIRPGHPGRNWRVGDPVAGVGIYNQPFKIRVPDVQPGRYLIQFAYGYSSASDAAVTGNACVTITVR